MIRTVFPAMYFVHILILFFLLAAAVRAESTDSYGYLVFWRNPLEVDAVPHSKTTRENAGYDEALAEMQAFCAEQDRGLPPQKSGCFAATRLHNSCAAAAWPSLYGLLRPANVIVSVAPGFQAVQEQALAQCRARHGSEAACDIETAFCTDSAAYGIGH